MEFRTEMKSLGLQSRIFLWGCNPEFSYAEKSAVLNAEVLKSKILKYISNMYDLGLNPALLKIKTEYL